MKEFSEQLAQGLAPGAAFPEWFSTLRESGARAFRENGLPVRRDEAWKYTGLGLLERDGARLAEGVETASPDAPPPAPLLDSAPGTVMLDGRVQQPPVDLPGGLKVLSLQDALHQGMDGLRGLLESLPVSQAKQASALGFNALNTATLGAGVVIHVAAGTDAGRLLLNWTTRSAESPLIINSRVCIILEKGAKLELYEQFENPQNNSNAGNIVVQAELAEKAELRHVRFQQEPESAVLITTTEIRQQASSDYRYFGFDLGGGLVRHGLHAELLGRGANAVLNGAYLVDGKRHVDNHSRVDHKAPGGFSEQFFRGVAGGSGRAVFNTAVCVHPGADETEARQSNANILLSKRAEVDTKPELEIYADEVVASHGATVGQLDEQAVFYLRARGLSEHQARQLLTTAFCRSVSDRLEDRATADVISQRMMDVMPQAE